MAGRYIAFQKSQLVENNPKEHPVFTLSQTALRQTVLPLCVQYKK